MGEVLVDQLSKIATILKIGRKSLEGFGQFPIVEIAKRSTGRILTQHPDRCENLADPQLGTKSSNLFDPIIEIDLCSACNHIRSPTRGW